MHVRVCVCVCIAGMGGDNYMGGGGEWPLFLTIKHFAAFYCLKSALKIKVLLIDPLITPFLFSDL